MDYPVLPRDVQEINRKLQDHFGIDTSTGQVLWRVVWSGDQYENRLVDCNDNGVPLLHPEVRLVPKYMQWVGMKWTLERLVAVPYVNMLELPSQKLSYEPMFPFEDKRGNAIQPSFEASKFIIDAVYAAMGQGSLSKYRDSGDSPEKTKARVAKIEQELFGDENSITDALARGDGVALNNMDMKVKEN